MNVKVVLFIVKSCEHSELEMFNTFPFMKI